MMTVQPATIALAGASWRVIYTLGAVRAIEERYSPAGDWLESGLEGFMQAQQHMSAGDIDALAAFLWAGMLHEAPAMRFDDALALLDEASPAELVTLPQQILEAILQATKRPAGDSDGSGEPWSWSVALAVWVGEWGRPEAEFWATTFRAFGAISDGRATLYKSSREGGQTNDHPEGWTLDELLTMGKRR